MNYLKVAVPPNQGQLFLFCLTLFPGQIDALLKCLFAPNQKAQERFVPAFVTMNDIWSITIFL